MFASFLGEKDAAVHTLQRKLAEVDAMWKKEVEAREAVQTELQSLQEKVSFGLACKRKH